MIDLHSHLLPGIDDGAPDLEASVAMGRAAVDGGVEQIVATPHVSGTYQNDPFGFPQRVAEVQGALDTAGLGLRVQVGAEVANVVVGDMSDEALRACTLGGGGYLLLEPPYTGPAPFIDRLIADLHARGYRVLIAHPERIGIFQRNVSLLEKLVEQGCLTSITAGSVSGQFGGVVKRFSADLFARGLVHNLASDAHDADWRSPSLRPVLDKACEELPGLEEWIGYLTLDVPRAILAGDGAPGPPPVLEPKRGLLSRLRGR